MALAPGTRLGPYEVVGSLGAGGMGEVYRARDTRLDRAVALKIIAPDLLQHGEGRARFEREARAISQLSHSGICALHDLGHHDGTSYLVLELLEGETLADRLRRGALPLADAILIATQMTDAVAAAHRAGVVHRDLKPANVMLVKRREAGSGHLQVKLLDFGLASMRADPAADAPAGEVSRTISAPLTVRGAILGTVPYMAPEQVQGLAADTRTDIWAMGCLAYEMLTGRRPFEGPTDVAVMGAILEREPLPIRKLAPKISPSLERIVQTCLMKDPDQRIQSAYDLGLQLRWAVEGLHGDTAPPRLSSSQWVIAAALLGLAAGAVAGAILWPDRGTSPMVTPVIRAAIPLPAGSSFSPFGSNVAMSPDGQSIVYAAAKDDVPRLYVRGIGDFDAQPLPGTEGAEGPFFSPDGRHIGFQASGRLSRIPVDGGVPTVIAEVASMRGAAWAPDDTIVFTPTFNDALWRVPASGGTPVPFTTLDATQQERTHRFPEILPDGRAVLFMVGDENMTSYTEARIMAQSLDGGPTRLVLRGGIAPKYSRSGHLVYNTGNALTAVAFDPARLEVTGRPHVLAEQVAWSLGFGTSHHAVGGAGHVVYIPGGETFASKPLTWMDRLGAKAAIPGTPSHVLGLRRSPDATRVLLLEHSANDLLRVYDLARQSLTRLTFVGSANMGGWMPDGRELIALVGTSILRIDSDRPETPAVLYQDETQKIFLDVSPDGSRVLFDSVRAGTRSDLMMLDVKTGSVKPWLASRFVEAYPRFSPDGRWVAYVSDESGRYEVFVRGFADGGRKFQVSTGGGSSPVWSPSGAEIYFAQPGKAADETAAPGDLMVAAFGAAGPSRPTRVVARAWSVATLLAPFRIPIYSYEPLPDGRFIIADSLPPPEARQINISWGALATGAIEKD